MSNSKKVTLLFSSIAFLLSSCKKRGFSDGTEESTNYRRSATVMLAANDVSILFPLPEQKSDRKFQIYLLKSDGGSVFPSGLERELPKLFSTAPGPISGIYQDFLVTSFRYDPCFPMLNFEKPEDCKAQVRLVAQYIGFNSFGKRVFDEVALHLFYDLTAQESKSLAADLLQLKSTSPKKTHGEPLFVHPALQGRDGLGSDWGKTLKATILKYAREENLSRITGMGFVFDAWPFFGVKIKNRKVESKEKLQHLASQEDQQSWDIFGDDKLLGNIKPESRVETGPQFFSNLRNYTNDDGSLKSDASLKKNIESVERILNPALHSPESVDCVSCHVTRFVKAVAEEKGVEFRSRRSYEAPAWANTKLMTDPRVNRAAANIVQFGYFLRGQSNHGLPPPGEPLPSVSERVINESIEVARFVSEKILD